MRHSAWVADSSESGLVDGKKEDPAEVFEDDMGAD
jgi:hypothetical protein